MNEMSQVTEVARDISDYGLLIVIGAAFIVLSFAMWVAIFQWFKTIINKILDDYKKSSANQQDHWQALLTETQKQNEKLNSLLESLRPATLLQVKSISNTCFDLAIERVCRIIKKVREENHIIEKEATRKKIRMLVSNLHEDRNSRLDTTKYMGKTLTQYTSAEWIDWVAEVVEKEVYSEPNNGRAYTNVEAVYAKIRLDFYHRLTE